MTRQKFSDPYFCLRWITHIESESIWNLTLGSFHCPFSLGEVSNDHVQTNLLAPHTARYISATIKWLGRVKYSPFLMSYFTHFTCVYTTREVQLHNGRRHCFALTLSCVLYRFRLLLQAHLTKRGRRSELSSIPAMLWLWCLDPFPATNFITCI